MDILSLTFDIRLHYIWALTKNIMKVLQLITTANGSYYDQFKKLYLHPNWQRRRLDILSRDDFKCTKCGCDDLPLHVHHDYYVYDLKPWEYDDEYLRTLCEDCHEEYHRRHSQYLFEAA